MERTQLLECSLIDPTVPRDRTLLYFQDGPHQPLLRFHRAGASTSEAFINSSDLELSRCRFQLQLPWTYDQTPIHIARHRPQTHDYSTQRLAFVFSHYPNRVNSILNHFSHNPCSRIQSILQLQPYQSNPPMLRIQYLFHPSTESTNSV